jgi:tetratricopeptide (TPR) repeat protein
MTHIRRPAAAIFADGLRHHQAGRLQDAERFYRQALAVDVRHADSLHLLGVVAHQTGRHAVAVELIGQAIGINANSAPFHSNLGLALKALGRPEEAVAAYVTALRLKPDYPEALSNLGHVLVELKRLDEACAAYAAALRLRPEDAETCFCLGNVLKDLERLDEALAAYAAATRLRPDYAEAYSNLGTVLKELDRLDESLAAYAAALRLQPGYAELHSNLGNVLKELGRLDEAVDAYRTALRLRPDFAKAHSNLGNALAALGRLDEAAAACAAALRFEPDYAEGHFNAAMVHLLQGDYEAGWRDYEWRWRRAAKDAAPRPFDCPQWDGGDIAGKTILLHPEQGFGDAIQFCRYVPLVAARGASVVLEVPRPLVRLLSGLPCRVVPAGTPLPAFDLHCPLMSLPLAFGTRLETVPAALPYLSADPAAVARWQERLGATDLRRVGIVWSGNPKHKNDRNRSLPLDTVARIGRAGCELVSLQKDVRADDACVLAARPDIRSFAHDLSDFADTAALVAAMDLVVTVDTSIAHLAGALGKPVWILLPVAPDWRWMLNREDNPWYPTARLFRQATPGDWDEVIERVTAELSR